MKKFYFKTDAGDGEIEAASLSSAKKKLIREEGLTNEAIENGAWGWIEDKDGNRLYIAEENVP